MFANSNMSIEMFENEVRRNSRQEQPASNWKKIEEEEKKTQHQLCCRAKETIEFCAK